MLRLVMTDGSSREMSVTDAIFDEMGVTFMNEEMKCKECVTWDKVHQVDYKVQVTAEMQDKSKKLQFIASDERPRGKDYSLLS